MKARANPQLVSLGEIIHDAIKRYATVRRQHPYGRPTYINHNLAGACVPSAYLLTSEANKRGIKCQMQLAREHAYVFYNGLLYDPTYTQYILPSDQEPTVAQPMVQIWEPDKIPTSVSSKYLTQITTTQQCIQYLRDNYYIEGIDGYQLHWISDKTAHISWSDEGTTINPIH